MTRSTRPPRTRGLAVTLALTVALALALVAGGIALAGLAPRPGRPAPAEPPFVRSAEPPFLRSAEPEPPSRARRLLAAWDARRSAAYAAGDVARLADLYVPGSRAGERDRRMLTAYVARGLVVTGLSSRVRQVRVEQRGRARLVLRVRERVRGTVRVPGEAGAVPLPRGSPVTRLVDLRRGSGADGTGDAAGWRVASVSRVRRGPAR